ncbi:MAG TPA: MATE family efflux transporter [Hyphomicrobiales bacterium]|nr:MATE family efflux transporter [Hyphomicrobiales bacterium]
MIRKRALRSREVLAIAIPMILSNATVPLVGIADIGVIGQLGDAALIGGVSLGATVFALLFWAFGFLRMGTTGLTAQAAGAEDWAEVAANLYRPLIIALLCGVILFVLHVPATVFILKLAGGSAEVQSATADYFGIRIMSAPATLANYALMGWFIGLARAKLAFLLQLFLNALNIALAVVLVLLAGKGVKGAALAAVYAEYAAAFAGIVTARRMLKGYGGAVRLFDRKAFARLMAVNGDIMIRTVCLLFAFTFFAAQGARLGDVALAANSVLRSLSDLSAYVLDGFAFAAEVLVGQAVGASSLRRFREAAFLSSAWSAALAAAVSLAFWAGGLLLIELMTTTQPVREAAREFLPWAAITPLAGFACFQLDGIFIGATRTADLRNTMILSLAAFLAAWAILAPAFGNHGLWASLMVFYCVRALTLGLRFPALERASFEGTTGKSQLFAQK